MTIQLKKENLLKNVRKLCKLLDEKGIKQKMGHWDSNDNYILQEMDWIIYEDDPYLTFSEMCHKNNREAFLYLKKIGALDKRLCWRCGESPIGIEYIFTFVKDVSYSLCKDCYHQGRAFQKQTLGYVKGAKEANSNCFIATACYGDINAPEVGEFRNFRDKYLYKFIVGSLFIKTYYLISPVIVKRLRKSPKIKAFLREQLLNRILRRIRKINQ